MEFISPVYDVKPVPIEKIVPNTYNPNAVAPPELELLYDSIKEDGYTMPVVVITLLKMICMLLWTVFIVIGSCWITKIFMIGKKDCFRFL